MSAPEYIPSSSPYRTHGHSRSSHVSSRWIRITYFGFAAVWGFLMGGAFVAFALRSTGTSFSFEWRHWGLVTPGLIAALLGAGLAAMGYRQARRRLGR